MEEQENTTNKAHPRSFTVGQLGRGAVLSLLINGIALGLSIVLQILLTHTLTPAGYGEYSLVLSWVSVLLLLAVGGADTVLLRTIPEFAARGEFEEVRRLARWSMKVGVCGGVGAASALLIGAYSLLSSSDRTLWATFLGGALFLSLWTLLALRQALMRGLKRVVQARLPDVILRPLLLSVFLIAGRFLSGRLLSGAETMMLHAGAAAITLTVALLFFRPSGIATAPSSVSTSWSWWRTGSLTFLLISLVTALLQELDKLYLGAILLPDEFGRYALASRLALFASFGTDALMIIAFPLLGEFFSTRSHRDLIRLYLRIQAGMAGSAVVVGVIFIFFGERLLGLFGDRFVGIQDLLTILVCGQCLAACFGPAGPFLLVARKEGEVLTLLILSGAVMLLLITYGFGESGMRGVAIATACAQVVRALLYGIETARTLRERQ